MIVHVTSLLAALLTLASADGCERPAGARELPTPSRAATEARLSGDELCLRTDAWRCVDLCAAEPAWRAAAPRGAEPIAKQPLESFYPWGMRSEGVDHLFKGNRRRRRRAAPLHGRIVLKGPDYEVAAAWTRAHLKSRALLVKFAGATLTVDGARHVLPDQGAPAPRHSFALKRVPPGLLVWGGYEGAAKSAASTGAVFDLRKRVWRPLPTQGAPKVAAYTQWKTLTWTDEGLLMVSGQSRGPTEVTLLSAGLDTWRTLSSDNAPAPYRPAVTFWTGRALYHGGKLYAPAKDRWRDTAKPQLLSPNFHDTQIYPLGGPRYLFVQTSVTGQLTSTLNLGVLDVANHTWTEVDVSGGRPTNAPAVFVFARWAVFAGGESMVMTDPGGGGCKDVNPSLRGCDPVGPRYDSAPQTGAWVVPLP